jgi:hypothetical protein
MQTKVVGSYQVFFYSCILVCIFWTVMSFRLGASTQFTNWFGFLWLPDVLMDQIIMLLFGLSFLVLPFIAKHLGWLSTGVGG